MTARSRLEQSPHEQAQDHLRAPGARLPADVCIRHLIRADLPLLEWEGEYTHFRRVFFRAYQNARQGRAVLWVAVAPPRQMLGQVFVLLRGARQELADGATRAYLYAIRVRPAYRNLGLGSRLIETAEQDLRKRGFRIATLNVARDNCAALRLYTRLGYQIVAEDPGRWWYYDHQGRRREVVEPAWRMEKELLG